MLFAKGTTTLAFKFQGGVIVSVDSRSTQGPYIGARARARARGHSRLRAPLALARACRSPAARAPPLRAP
jgi:hypothetical protein